LALIARAQFDTSADSEINLENGRFGMSMLKMLSKHYSDCNVTQVPLEPIPDSGSDSIKEAKVFEFKFDGNSSSSKI